MLHQCAWLAYSKQPVAAFVAAGLPVPRSVAVRSLEEATREARRIGFPVVLKPLDGNHGRGVKLNLGSAAQLEAVWDESRAESRGGSMISATDDDATAATEAGATMSATDDAATT